MPIIVILQVILICTDTILANINAQISQARAFGAGLGIFCGTTRRLRV
jgi:hypothetical protein